MFYLTTLAIITAGALAVAIVVYKKLVIVGGGGRLGDTDSQRQIAQFGS